MERYSNRKFDEQSRLGLPSTLIKERMSLPEDTTVVLHPVCGMIVLKTTNVEKAEEWAISKIDKLGRITLSEELRQRLGWQPRSNIAIYGVDDETVLLKMA
ncbi:MAG: AbrB/MazE/SpoVT family DNA-binding domain-containing protein [Defluviitaleaceae bacterium]|nr:AbrB/MazE/SpoVT family DNA-binding domain-containing protein [Defluviitaleaceae bacterium]